MSKPRVYVETTIPSLYQETRSAPEIVARREWTRQWWFSAANRYELVTSPAVLDELAAGPPERSANWLGLVAGLPVLTVEPAIAEIANVHTTQSHAGRSGWRCATLGAGLLSQMRLSRHVELRASC